MQEGQLQEGGGRDLFTVKNLIILLIGFILGYFVKMQAVETITMGYDDYKLSQWQSNATQNDVDSVDIDNKQAVENSEKNN